MLSQIAAAVARGPRAAELGVQPHRLSALFDRQQTPPQQPQRRHGPVPSAPAAQPTQPEQRAADAARALMSLSGAAPASVGNSDAAQVQRIHAEMAQLRSQAQAADARLRQFMAEYEKV